jgi:hypothetical protein
MDTPPPQVLKDALGVRALEKGRELWFAVKDREFADAHDLWQAGKLDRGWHGDDMVWRASDQAQAELEASFALAVALN